MAAFQSAETVRLKKTTIQAQGRPDRKEEKVEIAEKTNAKTPCRCPPA